MATFQSDWGLIEVREDFVGGYDGGPGGDNVTPALGGQIGSLGFASVNEGSLAPLTSTASGVIQTITDTGDNDNNVFWAGAFRPADGHMVLETRIAPHTALSTLQAIYVGFAETLAKDTPVMPAEFATATMTFNSANQVCLMYDGDATTGSWRAAAKNASNVVSSTNGDLPPAVEGGTGVATPPVVDTWDVIRVEIGVEGTWRVRLNGVTVKASTTSSATWLDPTKFYHAVVMHENRSGNAVTDYIDYVYVRAGRNWNTAV